MQERTEGSSKEEQILAELQVRLTVVTEVSN